MAVSSIKRKAESKLDASAKRIKAVADPGNDNASRMASASFPQTVDYSNDESLFDVHSSDLESLLDADLDSLFGDTGSLFDDLESEMAVPATKFSRFGKLPTELRLQIWRYAGLQPRVIPVHLDSHTFLSTHSSQQPALTRTCRESREEVLKFLKPFYYTAEEIEELRTQNFDIMDSRMALLVNNVTTRLPDLIYTNLDIDIFHLTTKVTADNTAKLTAALFQGRYGNIKNFMCGMDHLFQVSDPNGNLTAPHATRLLGLHQFLLHLDLQNLYFVLEPDYPANIARDGSVLPMVERVSQQWAQSVETRSLDRRIPSSDCQRVSYSAKALEQLHEDTFENTRQRTLLVLKFKLEMFDIFGERKIPKEWVKFIDGEMKRLPGWKMPTIKYLRFLSGFDSSEKALGENGFW